MAVGNYGGTVSNGFAIILLFDNSKELSCQLFQYKDSTMNNFKGQYASLLSLQLTFQKNS